MKPKVLVLMATYNGEKYLREQIESLLSQKDVEINIKVADDRSNDNTHIILQEYKQKCEKFDYYINETNKGFTYNFLDLIFSSNDTYDYYALCDQDDVWMDTKIISAINKIKDINNPKGTLYCSNLRLVNQNLEFIGYQEKKNINEKRYCGLTSNIATGCTCVLDNVLFKKVLSHYPENIYLHDYWIYLIAQYTGKVIYDMNSYINYRQHGNNQIGSNKKFFTKKKINMFFRPKNKTSNLLKKFIEVFENDIYEEDLKYVKIAAYYNESFSKKLKLIFSNKVKRREYNFLFKVKVILNKF